MNTLELDNKLNARIIAGKSIQALRTMYAEDVVALEGRQGRARAILPQIARDAAL